MLQCWPVIQPETGSSIYQCLIVCAESSFVHLVAMCGLDGIVVRRRAHDPRVMGSIPALATFEDSILGQGVNTNCASLHPGV